MKILIVANAYIGKYEKVLVGAKLNLTPPKLIKLKKINISTGIRELFDSEKAFQLIVS